MKTLTTEWEEMVEFQNSKDIVKQYTEDTFFIQKENGTVTQKHIGREGEFDEYLFKIFNIP